MTTLELKELIKPLNDEDRKELKRMLNSSEDTDVIHLLDELTRDLPASDAPTDLAENHHQYIRGRVMHHE